MQSFYADTQRGWIICRHPSRMDGNPLAPNNQHILYISWFFKWFMSSIPASNVLSLPFRLFADTGNIFQVCINVVDLKQSSIHK